MRKIIAVIMVLTMLLGTSAMADDLGVQIIGGPAMNTSSVSLEDMKLNTTYTIDGYAKITPTNFGMYDYFAQFNKGADYYARIEKGNPNSNYVFMDNVNGDWYYNWRYAQAYWVESGKNADFAWFAVDVTNMQKTSVKFMEGTTVTVVFDDEYVFKGWVVQVNQDYQGGQKDVSRYNVSTTGPNVIAMDPADEEAQDMLYTSTYVFVCALPNYVVNDKASPLRIEINMGGNELTYHIRK